MKKLIFSSLLTAMLITAATAQYGTERTGYEGDYFSLEGAIELFKDSRSVSNFEKKLNREDSWVNNLDLNYDGEIDYIRVEHRNQGDFHAIVLQAILGRRDVQDVAVIEIERTGRSKAVLQIIGDADLYGEEVIAEPYNSNGYSSRGDYDYNRGYVNVYHWSAVQHIIRPTYVTYVSPYRWNYYPSYWSPWNQYGWNDYHPRRRHYYNHCHIVYVHRVIRVHNFYRPFRSHSRHFAHHASKHRRTYGVSVAHRSQGKKHKTYRANTKGNKTSQVQPRNSVSDRSGKTTGRNSTVSPRSNRSTDKVVSPRSASPTRNSGAQIGRKEAQRTDRKSTTRVQSQRQQKVAPRSQSQLKRSSNSRTVMKSSATKPQTRKSSQSTMNMSSSSRTQKKQAPSRTQNKQSSQRTQSRQSSTRTQQRKAPARTQTRKAPVKQQSRQASPRTQSKKSNVKPRTSAPAKRKSSARSSSSTKSTSKSARGRGA